METERRCGGERTIQFPFLQKRRSRLAVWRRLDRPAHACPTGPSDRRVRCRARQDRSRCRYREREPQVSRRILELNFYLARLRVAERVHHCFAPDRIYFLAGHRLQRPRFSLGKHAIVGSLSDSDLLGNPRKCLFEILGFVLGQTKPERRSVLPRPRGSSVREPG